MKVNQYRFMGLILFGVGVAGIPASGLIHPQSLPVGLVSLLNIILGALFLSEES